MADETAADFADRIQETIDSASLALLISLGHQTGLFDVMAGLGAASGDRIAQTAGLDERYVREWLGGMTVARVVDYDPDAGTYRLPEHRAAALTRAAGLGNLARITQYIPLLAEVEQQILDCFRRGGGLAYSQYPRFHAVMAERSGEVFDHALIDTVLPLVDGLPELLRAGVDVADFGCGSGHAVNVMAREFTASRFVGIDFSPEGIARATDEAARCGLTNARFASHDLATLEIRESYDVITVFYAIHDQAHPAQVLANIFAALRPGGVLLMSDAKASSRLQDNVGLPMYTYRYTVSLMHCMPVSLGLDGAGLGTMWGRQLAVSMLGDAGFSDVKVAELDSDPSNYFYVARKS